MEMYPENFIGTIFLCEIAPHDHTSASTMLFRLTHQTKLPNPSIKTLLPQNLCSARYPHLTDGQT